MRALILLPLLAACGGDVIPPTAESCAAICAAGSKATPAPVDKAKPAPEPAAAAGGDLTAWEQEQVGPILEQLRAGVHPWDDQSVGVCQGKDKCDKYIGLTATELPAGDYILQAVLAVPSQGADWTVALETDCTTKKGDSTSSKQSSKSYPLKWPGPDRGYNLVPLRRIESPGKFGAQSCTYRLVAPHPDGDKVIEGSWSVPE